MSTSAVSGGDGSRWKLMQEMQPQSAGSSAPSSDITDLLSSGGASQKPATAVAAPDSKSTGSSLDNATSRLVSDVQSLLASLQSEASGSNAAGSASAGTDSPAASSNRAAPDRPDGKSVSGSTASSGAASSSPASSSPASSSPASSSTASDGSDPASMLGQIMQMLQAYGGQSSAAAASSKMSGILLA